MRSLRDRTLLARLLAALFALSLVAAACGGDDDDEEVTGTTQPADDEEEGERAEGGTLTYAADQEPTGFNGNTSKDNGTSVKNVTENIFYYAVKATPEFELDYVGLEGEPEIVSEDPQVVEWVIKEEAAWSDGTPVTTDDIEYYFEQTMNPENDVASTVGYDQITEFEKVDDKTFRATFEPNYGDFRGLWFDVPQKAFMEAQEGGWDTGLDENPGPSAGPYVFGEWVRGQSLTLERNDDWWGEPKPTLDSIVYRFIDDSGAQVDALRNAEVDMIYPQPQLDLVDTVEGLGDVNTEISFGPVFEHLTFNLENEFLKEQGVRDAIALGVDRTNLVEKLMKPFSEEAERLDQVVYMTNQEQYEPFGEEYAERDVEAAKAALAEAGFDEGEVTLRISTTAGNALREQQGELIKADLAEVGINLTIDNSDSEVLFGERLPNGDFDIANFAWVGGVFPISGTKQIYETGSDSNYGGYSSQEFDQLAKDGVAALDEEEQAEIGNEMAQVLATDLPVLPLYQKPTFLGVRDTFVGVEDNSTNEGPFWNSHVWGKAVQ